MKTRLKPINQEFYKIVNLHSIYSDIANFQLFLSKENEFNLIMMINMTITLFGLKHCKLICNGI